MTEKNNKPSAVMRAFIKEALDNPRKEKIYLQILDGCFAEQAKELEIRLRNTCVYMANNLAGEMNRPDLRSDKLVRMLAIQAIGPQLAFSVDIDTQYAGFRAEDIAALPGYKKLHEAARESDIAVDVSGLTTGEKGQPKISYNILKTYDEGRMDSTYGYPQSRAPEDTLPSSDPAKLKTRHFTVPGTKSVNGHYSI